MPRMKIVDDAIADVRSLIDESNKSTVDNSADILPSLNRGQIFAFDILARKYSNPLLQKSPIIQVAPGTIEMELPENIFEDRIEKIEFQNAGYFYECKRIDYRDITNYEVPSNVPIPLYHCIFGRTIRFLPAPDGSFSMRIWSIKEPDDLVISQGRISAVNVVNNYVVVEGLGSDVTANTDELNNFVNIIDGQTGTIKQTLQISSIVQNRIAFRTSPSRTSVLNRTVSSTLLSTVNADDYLAVVKGTCVPYFAYPIYNFIVQYAANEMNRKLKNESTPDQQVFDRFEQQVERSWVGREATLRVKMKSQHWMPRRTRTNRER
jgi:hypothetical protein